MPDKSLVRVGGICSILLGVSYILIGITYFILPTEQKAATFDPAQFLESFARNPTALTFQFWVFALGAVLAIAAVQAISETVRSGNEGWVRWTSGLAFIGFAVVAINNFRNVALLPQRAAAFVAGDPSTKLVIAASGPLNLDPQGWLTFGGVGLWVLVVSVLALRGGTLPKPLTYMGIAAGILYWFVVAGFASQAETLVAIAASLGGIIVGPAWYIWMGLIMLRRER